MVVCGLCVVAVCVVKYNWLMGANKTGVELLLNARTGRSDETYARYIKEMDFKSFTETIQEEDFYEKIFKPIVSNKWQQSLNALYGRVTRISQDTEGLVSLREKLGTRLQNLLNDANREIALELASTDKLNSALRTIRN